MKIQLTREEYDQDGFNMREEDTLLDISKQEEKVLLKYYRKLGFSRFSYIEDEVALNQGEDHE